MNGSGGRGGKIHVAGVAGVGMSALAQALAWSHDIVTGSDRHLDQGTRVPVLDALERAGIALYSQDGSAVDRDTEAVVFSETSPRLSRLNCRTYSVRRPSSQLLYMAWACLKAMYVILKEHPDWVITTGAECGVSAVIAGKLLFRKTIFVETASRYKTKTMAGRICYPLADKFYVQHEEALAVWGKKAEYIGGVL